MSKKVCELCGERPAAVPDRERMGRPIKRVCRECHAARLSGDIQAILAERRGLDDRRRGLIIPLSPNGPSQ